VPRTPEEIIQLLRAWVNGDGSYFGTVPCQIEQDDGPISTILIKADELELLALIRRIAPQRREERERRLLAEREARRLIFHDLLRRSRVSEATSTLNDFLGAPARADWERRVRCRAENLHNRARRSGRSVRGYCAKRCCSRSAGLRQLGGGPSERDVVLVTRAASILGEEPQGLGALRE